MSEPSRPNRPVDQLRWVAWFDVTNMQRRGYDLARKRLMRVVMEIDARSIDNELHPMITVLKVMRVTYGIPVYFEIRGNPGSVGAAQIQFEIKAALDGYAVVDMPAGFVAGLEKRILT